MANHKAPTQVTIAPYEEASQLKKTVDAYWKPFAVVAVLIAAAILWSQRSQQASVAFESKAWGTLNKEVELAKINQNSPLPAAAALESLASNLEDTSAAPWARILEVESLIESKDFEGAEKALSSFEARYADHALVTQLFPIGAEHAGSTLPEKLRAYIASEREFEAAHPDLFALPPLPDGSPRVEFETTAGKIVLGLYQDRAPEHVANFLKLVSSGYYDGVKFHRVTPGTMIQSGDPNSKVGDPTTWGQGGPDYTIPEEQTGLFHFKGALAAARTSGATESSGSQFYITTNAAHNFDGRYTVFGTLLEGEDAVRIIENSPLAPGTDRPENPTTITKATVLE
jgi:cyclophilin family peptidyl-prolyl cis-trans isomerase